MIIYVKRVWGIRYMLNKNLLIEESHKRSEVYGVNKDINHSKIILTGNELKKILEANKELIESNLYELGSLY